MKRGRDPAERPAHENEGPDAVWVLAAVFEGDLNAHRVRSDDRTLDAKLIADAPEVTSEILDRESFAVHGRPASTVSAKMPVHHSVVLSEPGG